MTDAEDRLSTGERERWERVGSLAAVALVLGYLETFVPLPIPGARIGLANIPVLMALAEGDRAGACWVAALKVAAGALLFGSPVALAYSLVGTVLALLTMVPLSSLPSLLLPMLSVVGATAHEFGQLLVARALLATPLVWYAAPPLFVAGCVTGWLCGLVAAHARSLVAEQEKTDPLDEGDQSAAKMVSTGFGAPRLRSTRAMAVSLAAWIAFLVAMMRAARATTLALGVSAGLLACAALGLRPRELWRALHPILPIAAISLLARVLMLLVTTSADSLGPSDLLAALAAAGTAALRLVAICSGSCALMRAVGAAGMAQVVGSPLADLGAKAEGPAVAFETALTVAPSLVARIEGDARARLASRTPWLDTLPQLVTDAYALAEDRRGQGGPPGSPH